jgi:hypothetical protein
MPCVGQWRRVRIVGKNWTFEHGQMGVTDRELPERLVPVGNNCRLVDVSLAFRDWPLAMRARVFTAVRTAQKTYTRPPCGGVWYLLPVEFGQSECDRSVWPGDVFVQLNLV